MTPGDYVPSSFSCTLPLTMPRDGAIILSDVPSPVLSVVCEPCGRRERYDVERLMRQYGWDAKLTDCSRRLLRIAPRGVRSVSMTGARRCSSGTRETQLTGKLLRLVRTRSTCAQLIPRAAFVIIVRRAAWCVNLTLRLPAIWSGRSAVSSSRT